MKVSVIIPLYKGKKYIKSIIKMIESNSYVKKNSSEIEVIFVNDFPEEHIESHLYDSKYFSTRLIINEKNEGIHRSRVNGLLEANGDFILFLDQDDKLTNNYFESQISKIKSKDIIVCNGYAECSEYQKYLYKYRIMQWTVQYGWFYRKFGNRIISPGQCLIKRSSIPTEWYRRIIKHNGADDMYLWMLMFCNGCNIAINTDKLYKHVYTSENTSLSKKKMDESLEEVIKRASKSVSSKWKYDLKRQLKGEDDFIRKIILIVEKMNRTSKKGNKKG